MPPVDGDVEIRVAEIHRRREVVLANKHGNVARCVHPEVRRVEMVGVQLFEIQNRTPLPIRLGDAK